MDTTLFVTSLLLGAAGPMLAIRHLRPILERVLRGLCDADGGSEFWIRCATLMVVSGTLLLTLTFGNFDAGATLVDALRRALWLALAGVFATVAIVSANVWSQVNRWLADRQRGGVPASIQPATVATVATAAGADR